MLIRLRKLSENYIASLLMPKLILLRHLKSQWNKESRFTGWVDIPLAKGQQKKVKEIAKKVFKFKIDRIYTSPLFRNEDTVVKLLQYGKKYPVFAHLDGGKMQKWATFKQINKAGVPVFVSQALNERHYGRLQGLNKELMMKKYGKEKVRVWRIGYGSKPPGGESLRQVVTRTTLFYKKFIAKDLRQGKNVLVVASHHSLRAIVKYVEKISDKDIINVEIPYGGIKIYNS
ncbi:MAG: 2,3-bisphosphoglycerate-dependent phosphoglycerate mutase [Parcubacteria group bacterium Gr01-1014_30]|nr:MAG: 2,3-bisphosphoglycerate-dependent phosphoglycerate mutase [Parcubacteria group bacterium Gr01-1014_30]